MERAVRVPDGRTLAVEDAGDPAGRVVLVHGGTPNPRHLYSPWVADTARRGLRLIGYDPTLIEHRVSGVHAWLSERP